MIPFYAEYINHILRYYTRHSSKKGGFKSEADKLNYIAADRVFSSLNDTEKGILVDVYTRNDTLGDNVYEVAKSHKINHDDIYTLITRVSNKIARERKLI